MALYLGDKKLKVNLDGSVYYLNLLSTTPITNGIRLLSSDGYILKDSNRLYLTVKESIKLLSSDNYMLKDSNGLYLTVKESE